MVFYSKLLFNAYLHLLPLIHTQPPSSPQKSQSKRHSQTVPNDIQLAPLDLLPTDGYLDHGNVSALGQHEHLDVEDPAFGVHVRHNVGKRRSGEELETALGVFDLCCFGRGKEAEEQVEGVHESVAEEGALRVLLVSSSLSDA